MSIKSDRLVSQLQQAIVMLALGCESYVVIAATPPNTQASSSHTDKSQSITMTNPMNGWKYSGLNEQATQPRVSYPYSPIHRGAQRNRTMIKGQVFNSKKGQQPTLIVNGNPMSLNADDQGLYERYYALGSGSNTVEAKTGDGKHAKRVQFYEANRHQLLPKLRIICTWDAPEAEVDLHILTPDGQHITYYHPILTNGGGLDLDSVDGPGPEIFTTVTPVHGVYKVYINYWGSFDQVEGYSFDQSKLQKPIITSRITLVFNENTPREKRESIVVPLRRIGDLTLVKEFIY